MWAQSMISFIILVCARACEPIEPRKTWCEQFADAYNPVRVKVTADLSPKGNLRKNRTYMVDIIASSKLTTNPKSMKVITGGILGCEYLLETKTEYLLSLDADNRFFDQYLTISRPWKDLSKDQKAAFYNKGNCCVGEISGGCSGDNEICLIEDGKSAYCGTTCWSTGCTSYPNMCSVDYDVYPPAPVCTNTEVEVPPQ